MKIKKLSAEAPDPTTKENCILDQDAKIQRTVQCQISACMAHWSMPMHNGWAIYLHCNNSACVARGWTFRTKPKISVKNGAVCHISSMGLTERDMLKFPLTDQTKNIRRALTCIPQSVVTCLDSSDQIVMLSLCPFQYIVIQWCGTFEWGEVWEPWSPV